MIRFADGPAAGEYLMLRRAPLYLRAVQHALSGDWDALDQLADAHGPADLVTVGYRRIGAVGAAMVYWTEKGRRRGGCFASAEYELVADQPGDDVVRDTERWREWCYARQRVDFPKAGVT